MDVETKEEWAKKNRERYEQWENSLEGILYNLKIIGEVVTDDEYNKILIAKTLQKLPEDVRDKVLDEVFFVLTAAYGTVWQLYFPVEPEDKEIRRIFIILNLALMRNEGETDSEIMDTVAHEIAHYVLGHYGFSSDPKERNADDLTEKWGFKRAYDNYEWEDKIAEYNKQK